jgi:hypothetical protein
MFKTPTLFNLMPHSPNTAGHIINVFVILVNFRKEIFSKMFLKIRKISRQYEKFRENEKFSRKCENEHYRFHTNGN